MNLGSVFQAYAACELEQQQVLQYHSELEAYQTKKVRAITRIFSEQQPCSTQREDKLQKEHNAKLDRMERTLKNILAGKLVFFLIQMGKHYFGFTSNCAAIRNPGNQHGFAHVPESVVPAKMNAPMIVSCAVEGKHVNLCVWELNKINGGSETIVVDKQVEANDGGRISQRIWISGHGLSADQRALEIHSVTSNDLGKWACSLVTDDGEILIGELDVIDESDPVDSGTFLAVIFQMNKDLESSAWKLWAHDLICGEWCPNLRYHRCRRSQNYFT